MGVPLTIIINYDVALLWFQPGVGYAVIKGEVISKSHNYRIKN